MSINDSIGNSTIGSTAPAGRRCGAGRISRSRDRSRTACERLVSICDAGKQKQLGRIEQRKTASSWRRACSCGSLLHLYGNCRQNAQETDCGKATGTATETSRNEAGQRQRHACYGHRAYCRAGQCGRPTWPRRHPADTRTDRSSAAKIEFRCHREACYGKTTSRANAGQRANIRRDATEVGRSGALWQRIEPTHCRRASSKTH